MNSYVTQDKRQYLRLPRPYRVQVRELVFPIAKNPLLEGPVNDISKGGLCIESPEAYELGTRLHVSVHIPLLNKFSTGFFKVYENDAEQYFQAIAEVAWCEQVSDAYLVGIKFINIDEDLSGALGRLIEKAFLDEAYKVGHLS